MQVVILAGGKGTRLKPFTAILPKPLMPIGDIPILEIILKQLKLYGFNKVILALGHKAKLITTFFGNGAEMGLDITYSYEKKDLGTAAPLTLIKKLDKNFLIMNGDILTDLDYRGFFETHVNNNAGVTIATYNKTVNIDLGVIKTEEDLVIDYIEKPTMKYEVSMGIYAFNHRVIKHIPYNEYFDFPDLIEKLLSVGETIKVYRAFDHIWLDIGRVEDFQQSLDIFERNKDRFLPNNLK